MKSVTIPHDYFLNMSKKDYTNYKTALIREFLQNSVDAGSKQVIFSIDTKEKSLTVFDDGCGMSKDILLNKLLVLGESFKNNKQSIGAFGHAKLLLYFSWPQWSIETKDNKVFGESHYYKIIKTDDFVDGTISKIFLTDDGIINGIINEFGFYLDKCEIDVDVRLYVNNDLHYHYDMNKACIKHNKIYTDENVDIYDSKEKSFYLYVRQNGLFMFQEYLPKHDFTPIVEIKKSPYEMLLQNRDYFKKPYDEILSNLKNQFGIDSVKSFALNNEKKENDTIHINELDNIREKLEIENVAFYKIKEIDIKKLLNVKRNRRLLHIMNRYIDILRQGKIPEYVNINVGLTLREDVIGLMQIDRKNNDTYVIYINYKYFSKISPNYREMAIKLYHTIIHELAHVVTYIKHTSLTHDENFMLTVMDFYNSFWNITNFVKIFRETWSEVK